MDKKDGGGKMNTENTLETAVCRRNHTFWAGYVWCPVCEVYDEADKEDSSKQVSPTQDKEDGR